MYFVELSLVPITMVEDCYCTKHDSEAECIDYGCFPVENLKIIAEAEELATRVKTIIDIAKKLNIHHWKISRWVSEDISLSCYPPEVIVSKEEIVEMLADLQVDIEGLGKISDDDMDDLEEFDEELFKE